MTEDEDAQVLPFAEAPDAIELRHLRSFVAVAEELNFRRAAERLYITQPALSRQIRALERLVGSQLLRRSTHSVELTLAGEALLERARRLLREVDDTVRAVRSIGGEIAERIMRLWQPVEDHALDDGDLHGQRTAYEAMLAHVEVPSGVHVRPITAGGVPALLVGVGPGAESDALPRILYLHGGGFVLGSAFGYRPLAAALALASGCGVLVLDYPLAPEQPFPAALDHATRAYRWLVDQGADLSRLVVAGDSVGAGLGLALLLRLRDEGVPLPAGAALLCPITDLGLPSIGTEDGRVHPAQRRQIEVGRRLIDAYLAGHPATDPQVSPVRGNLEGLPPLLIQAAAGDPMAGDAHTLHDRAQAAGVRSELQLYPVDAHIFQLFWSFLPEAADAIAAAAPFLTSPADATSSHDVG